MESTRCDHCGREPKAERMGRLGIKGVFLGAVAAMMLLMWLVGVIESKESSAHKAQTKRILEQLEQQEQAELAAMPPEQRAAAEARQLEQKQALEQAMKRAAGQVWIYTKFSDSQADKQGMQARIDSVDAVGAGHSGDRSPASLLIVDHPRYGSDVLVTTRNGWFACGLSACTVQVQFDDSAIAPFTAAAPFEIYGKAVAIRDFDGFLSQTLAARKVRIQAHLYGQGERVFEFDVHGLEWPAVQQSGEATSQ